LGQKSSFWDKAYHTGDYRKHWHYSRPSQELATLLATGIVKRGQALDIGCGAGTETVFLAQAGFKVFGLDVSLEAIRLARKIARERKLKIVFESGTALSMPYTDSKFTFLNDRGCLHNIEIKNWRKYASEATRVARTGAYFLLRGADDRESEEEFTRLNERRLSKYFGGMWEWEPPKHYSMVSDAGTLKSLVAVMRRK